jgi:hypothetical protein
VRWLLRERLFPVDFPEAHNFSGQESRRGELFVETQALSSLAFTAEQVAAERAGVQSVSTLERSSV